MSETGLVFSFMRRSGGTQSMDVMQRMQEQQVRLLELVESLSVSTQEAVGGLEARLLALEAKMRSVVPGMTHLTIR